jgi:hypothetical protein
MSSATTLEQVNLNLHLERIRTDIKLRIVLRKAEVAREYWMLGNYMNRAGVTLLQRKLILENFK